MTSLTHSVVKNLPANAGAAGDASSIPRSGRPPGGGKWQSIPVLLPRRSHGQRSLVGYSPWGHKESDMTEHTHSNTLMVQQLVFLFWTFNLLFRRVFFSGKHQDTVPIPQKTAGLQFAGKLSGRDCWNRKAL